jgi:RHS repeat-associated protein
LGSVRQLVDAGGNVKLTEAYEPYGSVLSSQGSATSAFGFIGEQFESYIELLFLRARYMQPGLGVFLSRDLWEGYEEWPGTYNGFNYAMGNPVNLSDPAGLVPPIPNWPKSGLEQFIECLQLHTVSQYLGDYFYHNRTAQQAVNTCRAAYNQAYSCNV